jgi:ankyrin repeat protein
LDYGLCAMCMEYDYGLKLLLPFYYSCFTVSLELPAAKFDVKYEMTSEQGVIELFHKSVVHILGGGINPDTDSGQPRNQWLRDLKELAIKSICYPNGGLHDETKRCYNHENSSDRNVGKPHDIESRFSLSVFHKNKTMIGDKQSIQVISDLGLIRIVDSPMELAILLVNEMENILWSERNEELSQHSSFSPVIKAANGIITLVTPQRVAYLRQIGRLPCSNKHCTIWTKGGTKGLWWHELNQHQVGYSTATSGATTTHGIHDFAIVVYNNTTHYANHDNESVLERSVPKDDTFFQSVKNNDLNLLQSLLSDDANRKTPYDAKTYLDRNGASALHWAAGCGYLTMVKYLIEQISCPPEQPQRGKRSFRNRTPLHWAARNNHLNVVKYLVEECNVNIDSTTIDGTTAFCWACWQGNIDIMEYLVRKGANINSVNQYGCNAALWCAQSDNSDLRSMMWLHSIGVDIERVNDNGHSIFHKAAQRGKAEIIKWWISIRYNDERLAGAIHMIAPDEQNCTPSDLAGAEGYIELARWLVDQEIMIVLKEKDRVRKNIEWLDIALLEANKAVNREGIDDLFEQGAGVKKISRAVWTSLHSSDNSSTD